MIDDIMEEYDEALTELAKTDTQAKRFNAGKAEISQVPTSLIKATAEVMMFGATKYGKNNWKKGMPLTSIYDSLQRHLMAWLDGENLDSESGLNHLGHAACNLAFLIEISKDPKWDDRDKAQQRAMLEKIQELGDPT